MTHPTHKSIHVVAAVIENTDGKILIAKRPLHVHQGGLWEFPGGKVEPDESIDQALQRELSEELNIQIKHNQALIQIQHNYPDKSVFLDVRHVRAFCGAAIGNEGQQILWVDKSQLNDFNFPAANKSIINAIQLPGEYLITPEHQIENRDNFLRHLESRLKNGITLVQLRAKRLSSDDFFTLYNQVNQLTRLCDAKLQVNTSIKNAIKLNANGVHLSSALLLQTNSLPSNLCVSASCHNQQDVEKANQLGVHFIVLSPVQITNTHPNAEPIGWKNFSRLCQLSRSPAYALGGMKKTDRAAAIHLGGQGIAAISSLWQDEN